MQTKIQQYLKAGYPSLFVLTHEEARAEAEIHKATQAEGFKLHSWSLTTGIIDHHNNAAIDAQGPEDALRKFVDLPEKSVLILRDFQSFWKDENPLISRLWKDAVRIGKASNRTLIACGCRMELPPELEKEITPVELDLPSRAQLAEMLASLEQSAGFVRTAELEAILDAASGLTTTEAENAFALAQVTSGHVDPVIVHSEKALTIKKNGLLELIKTDTGLDSIGGLDLLKAWLIKRRAAFTKDAREYGLPTPKGFMMIGIPGCLHGDTILIDPLAGTSNTVRQRHAKGEPFHVIARTPEGHEVIAVALPPLKYPVSKMLTFALEDGQEITVTPHHRFLTADGWREASQIFAQIQQGQDVLLPKPCGACRLSSREDDRHYSGKASGSQAGYLRDHRSHGEPLPTGEDNGQDAFPSPADVKKHSRPGYSFRPTRHADVLPALAHTSSPCEVVSLRPSMPNCGGLSEEPSHRSFSVRHSLDSDLCQVPSQSQPATTLDRKGLSLSRHVQHSKVAFCSSSFGYIRMRTARQAPSAEYFDFHVPEYHNYLACGVFHHNCGKSLTAKACAQILNVPLLRLDAGKLFGSLVGESEANLRAAIQTAEAIAPVVLHIDEIEKSMSGSKSSGGTDGGTCARVFSTFLQWLQDKTSPVFVVATANDVSALPPEFLRAGRWDKLFFVDLPEQEERAAIWGIQIAKRGRNPADFELGQLARLSEGWTGSEIETCFCDALYAAYDDDQKEPTDLTIAQVATSLVPLSQTMKAEIDALRQWANGRAARASTPRDNTRTGRKLAA